MYLVQVQTQVQVPLSFVKSCPQLMVYNLDTKPFWKPLVDDIEAVEDIPKKLPWFLECNPDRFPYWFGKLDPRNAHLLAAMHSGGPKKDQKPLVSTYDFVWR